MNVGLMTFDECVAEIEALSGELVKVEVRGRHGSSPSTVAEFWGVLGRVGEPELPPEFAEKLAGAERAVMFVVGDGVFDLWPSRFLSAAPIEHRLGWFEIQTQDVRVLIGPKRPAWFD